MILRLQHIGTAHRSHASAAERLRQVGLEPAELRTDQGRGFQLDSRKLLGNECWLHVVHNWNPEARVCRYLRSRGEGLEHIAIETDDIEGAVARVKESAPIFEDRIFHAADGFEAFVYPADACGFTVEVDPAARLELELARPAARAGQPAPFRPPARRSGGGGAGSGRREPTLRRAVRGRVRERKRERGERRVSERVPAALRSRRARASSPRARERRPGSRPPGA